jgi:hypothetical protein
LSLELAQLLPLLRSSVKHVGVEEIANFLIVVFQTF